MGAIVRTDFAGDFDFVVGVYTSTGIGFDASFVYKSYDTNSSTAVWWEASSSRSTGNWSFTGHSANKTSFKALFWNSDLPDLYFCTSMMTRFNLSRTLQLSQALWTGHHIFTDFCYVESNGTLSGWLTVKGTTIPVNDPTSSSQPTSSSTEKSSLIPAFTTWTAILTGTLGVAFSKCK